MATNQHSERLIHHLRDKHRELLPYVERVREVADAVGDVPIAVLRQRLDDIRVFLTHQLLPHAHAEDQVIYPLLASMLGTLEVTSLMNRDHIEISIFAEDLAAILDHPSGARLRPGDAKALRRILYGLFALLRVHLEQEEVYLGLLDAHLTPEASRSVLEALEDVERKANAGVTWRQ